MKITHVDRGNPFTHDGKSPVRLQANENEEFKMSRIPFC